MTAVKVAQRAIDLASENRNGRVLMSFAVFAAEVVFESAFPRAQQTQPVPTATPCELSQRGRIGRGDDRKVNILSQMMCDAIEAVDPRGAHRTSFGLFLSKHELID